MRARLGTLTLVCLLAAGGCSRDGTYLLLRLTGTTGQPVSRFVVDLTHGTQHASATFTPAKPVALPPEQQLSLTLTDHPTGDIGVLVTADFSGGGMTTASDTAHVGGRGTTELTLVFGGGAAADLSVPSDGGDLASSPDDGNPVPPDLRGTAAAASFAVTPSLSAVTEHQQFTLHLQAKNASGQPENNYQGTATLSSSWGDVTPLAPPVFTNGVCDITVSLNRETRTGFAGAFITAADGAATGMSTEIIVTVSDWKVDGTAVRLARTYTKSGMTLGESLHPGTVTAAPGGGYRLISDTTIHMGLPTPAQAFFIWSSMDGLDWGAGSGTKLAGSNASAGVSGTSILWDGTQYHALYSGTDSTPTTTLLGATSPDGVTWTDEMLTAGSIFQCNATPVGMLFGYGVYTRLQGSVNYVCTVGITGTTQALTGVTTAGSPWSGYVKEGSVSKLWAINGGKTYYFTSSDGISWLASPTVWAVPIYAIYWNKERGQLEGFTDQSMSQTYYRAFRP